MQFIEIAAGYWRRLADVHRAKRQDDGRVELQFIDGERATVDESTWRTATGEPAPKTRTRKAA